MKLKKEDPFDELVGLDRVKHPTYKLMEEIWKALPEDHPDKERGGFDVYMRERWCWRWLMGHKNFGGIEVRPTYVSFHNKSLRQPFIMVDLIKGDLLTALLVLVRKVQEKE